MRSLALTTSLGMALLGCGSVTGDTGADADVAPDAGDVADAALARFDVTVDILGDGDGEVTLTPPGMVCSTGCTKTYAQGTEITISVAPEDGSFLAGFGGDCAGTDPCSLVVDRDRAVTVEIDVAVVVEPLVEGDENSVAVPSSGAPYVFFHAPSPTGGTPDLGMLRCADTACSSFTTDELETAGDTGLDPTALIGPDDLPVVAYHQAGFGGEAKIRACNDADCGSTSARFFENSGDGRFNSMILDAAGHPAVVYRDEDAGTIDLARCDDPRCSSFAESSPVVAGAAERVALVSGSDGRLAFAYYDAALTALRFTHCDNDDCTEATTVTIDGGPGVDAGEFFAAAVGADGFPFFAYYDATNGDLRVARCTNATCTTQPIVRRVDGDETDAGTHVSMVVLPDGRPLIAYYDATLGDLDVALCDDAACSASATRRVAGEFTNVGRFTSIALDPSGLPVIVFQDADTGILSLARCRTPSCGL